MLNQLFNQAYLDKYSENFQIDENQQNIIKGYIEKLESNGFQRERSNYTYFYVNVLNGLLGYEIDISVDEDVPSDHGSGFSEFILKKNEKKFMVIELKKQDQDLDRPQSSRTDRKTPVEQAFEYAGDNEDVDWILVSNFHEFRLYNWEKKKNKYISFNFEELLNEKCFQYFMLIFSLKSHEEGIIQRLMDTISVDWEFESNFYNLYHQTRLMLISELEIHGFETVDAIHYAQKILNRYIFICFVEDKGLITPETSKNTIISTLGSGILGRDNIWRVLNDLFLDLNEGSKINPEIRGFNGGLFKENLQESGVKIRDYKETSDFQDIPQEWDFQEYEDEIKEDIIENVSPLFQHKILEKINPIFINFLIISRFNFKSQVDVNILGRIFENSIDDLERIQEERTQEDSEDTRKSHGIYYTPEFITDYMCRNAIIPYLSLSGDAYTIEDLILEYSDSIDDLDQKLQDIKILDPSCGSGAFLNKSADILVEIHEMVHQEKYKDDHTLNPHIDNLSQRKEVLTKNIFGVDINRESVGITKLSLFLKIAQKKDPKLPIIEENIQCGNSLVSDSEFTHNPFTWKESFESICGDGFDIIVGNPPYVSWSDMKERTFFENGSYMDLEYKCRPNHDDAHPNIYLFFLVRSINLLKDGGYLSFIIPQEWLYYAPDFRDYYLNKIGEIKILKFHPEYRVFKNEDESIGTNSLIIQLEKNDSEDFCLAELGELDDYRVNFFLKRYTLKDIFTREINEYSIKQNTFSKSRFFNSRWEVYSEIVEELLERFNEEDFVSFNNKEFFKVFGGFQPNVELSKKYIISENELSILNDLEREMVLPCIYDASDIKRYYLKKSSIYWIVLNGKFNDEAEFRINCPNLHQILSERLEMKEKWWEFPNVRNLDNFRNSTEKILSPRTAPRNSFCIDQNRHVIKGTNSCIISEIFPLMYVLGILNSELATYWYRDYGYSYHGGQTKKFEPANIRNFMIPIKKTDEEKETYVLDRVTAILDNIGEYNSNIHTFRHWLRYKLKVNELTPRLNKFQKLNSDEFVDEVQNLNDKLKVDELEEITNEFSDYKSKINRNISLFLQFNNEINRKIYEIYDLDDESINIIKNS